MRNSSSSRYSLLAVGLLLAWLFGVLGLFYTVQKPFTVAAAGALAGAGLDGLAAAWLALLGLGLGLRLLRWLGLPALSTGETLVLGTGLGLGGLGFITLGLGLAGLLNRWLFIGLSLALTALLWPDILRLWRRLRRWQPDRPARPAAIFLVATALLGLGVALLPPVDWDGLFYHLTAPKLFIRAGGIYPGIDVPHFNFPFLAEMLFTYAMLLRGDIAAKLIHTLYGFLLAGLVYLTAARRLNRAAGWPAMLVLLSMPMIVTLAGWAYNDLALTFYQLAALYAFMGWAQERRGAGEQGSRGAGERGSRGAGEQGSGGAEVRWLVLSGIMAGLAMGLKYTSFIAPVVILLLLVWSLVKNFIATPPGQPVLSISQFKIPWPTRQGRQNLKFIIDFALPAFLVALPWYAKNLWFTGNPVYPFVFGGTFWDDFRTQWYSQGGSGIGFDPLALAGLPVLLTLGTRDANYFDGRTGPLFLAFLPLVLVYGVLRYRASARPAGLDTLLVFSLAQFLFWAAGVVWSSSLWQSRLLLPGLAALCPVVGWLWLDLAHLDRPRLSVRRFANLVVGLVLAFSLVELSLSFIALNPLAYLTGGESRADNLARRLGTYYGAMTQLNETLPPAARVLFLWEPRSYYCQLDCRPDSILDEFPHLAHRYGTAPAIAASWQQAGITHVLIHRAGLNFITGQSPELIDSALLASLERCYLRPVFDVAGAYQVYEFRPEGCP